MNILLIEDESKLSLFLKRVLESKKYTVMCAESVETARRENFIASADLLILDLMLPGESGRSFLQYLRKSNIDLPVLVLSAKDFVSTKVTVLEEGADDYLTKPFSADELLARVHALRRRYVTKTVEDEIVIDDFTFSRTQNRARRGGRDIFLTKKEADVLSFLITHRGKAVRNEDILVKVWHTKTDYHSNIVQATIRRLRKKIDDGFSYKLIRNIHGVGYMIAPGHGAKADKTLKAGKSPKAEKVA